MQTQTHEPDEEVLSDAPHGRCRDANADQSVREELDISTVGYTMFEVEAELAVEPGEGEEDACRDEVIPGRKGMVAVEEEEERKNQGGDEVGDFKPFVGESAMLFC